MYLYAYYGIIGEGFGVFGRDNPSGITWEKRGGDLCILESVFFS